MPCEVIFKAVNTVKDMPLRYILAATLLTMSVTAPGHSQGPTWTDNHRREWLESNATIEKKLMVPMRDGTLLATDIYFPARDGAIAKGQFPALMERTPYGKNGGRFETVGSYFASRGYVVVVQDIRGRFESEGEFYIYVNDGPDGYDATEWIAAQSWSDGQVGGADPR